MVSSGWLYRHLLTDLQANLDCSVESLQKLCLDRYRLRVKLRLLYKVRGIAKERIYGGFNDSYGLLPGYVEMIKTTNPGSYSLITWSEVIAGEVPVFKACFISFACMVRGFFGGCRPLIGINGAHLSSHYKGQMLTVVAIDRNNELVHFAYGIVDTESLESWSYFVRNMKIMFAQMGVHREDWTSISDRMRGVDSALYDVFPKAVRRVCAQHLYSNCKNAGWSSTTFHDLFWVAANAYNLYVFNKSMEKTHKHDPAAVELPF
ncbi:uncharacterized protein LOC104888909 [Beta vulgaris subsp. vulgaris]|uniref:uncharacterized protein LOC104888909 n=1 Tax=Beta vulgaris subsp. vulgaris TaxID=3555 RepID=UPI0005400726|nr:uncharacterized protein LOC104888909 [Beta vulgaris subsp. vulgaris]